MNDLEAIRQLKARYFRYLDTKRWDDWLLLFTDDVVGDFGDITEGIMHGSKAIVDCVKPLLTDATSVHHGHMPEIEIIDKERARGIWSMEDVIDHPDFYFHGYGYYHEEYRKIDGEWKISQISLVRLKLDFKPR